MSKDYKYDVGKPRMELLLDMSNAMEAIAELLTIGAEKYEASSWLTVKNGEKRYTGALMRHLFTDEECDQETHVLHDTAVACNALFVLELKLRRIALGHVSTVSAIEFGNDVAEGDEQ